MPRWRLFYHVVWATRGRESLLDDRAGEIVEGAIKAACREQGVIMHAVGIMPDHVHVAASIPPAVAIGTVVGRWKGAASHLLNHAEREEGRTPFAWQAEYAVMSFGEKALPGVIAYVQNQPARHATQHLWDALEQVEDRPVSRLQPASSPQRGGLSPARGGGAVGHQQWPAPSEPTTGGNPDLIQRAETWIAPYWNADHLRRTVHWLRVLDPDPSPALLLAALTHDMERHFPAPDAPVFDARRGPADPDYRRRHQERSARIVADWLREQGADEGLVEQVAALIAVHEDGGWPEADLLQAADSLSFLEVNVELFVNRIPTRAQGVGPDEARNQFRRMYERIQVPRAREFASPLYEAAVARVDEFVATHPEVVAAPAGVAGGQRP